MPRIGFEPTIPVFEWAKTVHAVDREATVIGFFVIKYFLIQHFKLKLITCKYLFPLCSWRSRLHRVSEQLFRQRLALYCRLRMTLKSVRCSLKDSQRR
jgi:hypothetical protein